LNRGMNRADLLRRAGISALVLVLPAGRWMERRVAIADTAGKRVGLARLTYADGTQDMAPVFEWMEAMAEEEPISHVTRFVATRTCEPELVEWLIPGTDEGMIEHRFHPGGTHMINGDQLTVGWNLSQ
jgi:hypothetical protein